MLKTTLDEVDQAFKVAKNLNSALKNFLKKEVKDNEPLERFVKDFRISASSGRPAAVRAFIEQKYNVYPSYFLFVAQYAHAAFINPFSDSIFNKFGEAFNSTYEEISTGIKIKNSVDFSSIVKEVISNLEEALKIANLPVSNFMKNTVLICIFEENVLKEVLKILQE